MSGHDGQARETPARDQEAEYLAKRVEELENENIHLKISKAANEQVINQLNSERKEFMSQVTDMSYRLGEAQAKLQLLDAPRPEAEARHLETRPVEQVSDAVEVPSGSTHAAPAASSAPSTPPATAAAEPGPAKRGFLGRMFGR
jgi:peptidoglycan hydrolase CwlO-like protein